MDKFINTEELHRQTVLKVLFNSSVVIALIVFTSLFFVTWAEQALPKDTSARVWIGVFFTLFAIWIRKWKKVRAGNVILNLFLFIIIPVRLYFTGGLSPLIFEYVFHSSFNFALNGKKMGVLTLCWGVGCVAVFDRMDQLNMLPEFQSHNLALSVFLMLLLVTVPLFFVLEEKDLLANETKRLETRRASFLIMQRMNHEIGNSLQVALGMLESFEREGDAKYLAKAEKSLMEINAVTKLMGQAASEGELVELLEKNQDQLKLIRTLLKP